MKRETRTLKGDTPGQTYSFEVITFRGADKKAPNAYLQAALHGGEFPGVAAIHFLVPILEAAEKAGQIMGNITVVPMANPIGMSQWLFGEHLGRFDFFSRINFNRSHFALENFDTSSLPKLDDPVPAHLRLKAELLRLAQPNEIILDLHCDDESEQYAYIPKAYWPGMKDFAVAVGCKAVLLWEGACDHAFDEANAHPIISGAASPENRAVTTMEFKGSADVSQEKGKADAKGLYDFLVHRGVIDGKTKIKPASFTGHVTPLENVEMISMPEGGMVFYHVEVGDTVKKGAKLATIVTRPGDTSGDMIVTAPQAGYILTRRALRFLPRGDDLLKLLGTKRSPKAKPGALEA